MVILNSNVNVYVVGILNMGQVQELESPRSYVNKHECMTWHLSMDMWVNIMWATFDIFPIKQKQVTLTTTIQLLEDH